MKITLVNLPTIIDKDSSDIQFPQALGLLSLASTVSPAHKVAIISPCISRKKNEKNFKSFYIKTAHKIINNKPEIIGMTTRCDSLYHTLMIAKNIRSIDNSVPILLGGPQASICDIDILNNFPYITAIIRGEGEISFPQYIEAIEKGNNPNIVNNLTYRKDGKIARTPDALPIKDLDALPKIDFSLIPKESLNNPYIEIEVGRGCPFNCIFCSTSNYFNHFYRLKSPSRIVQEMESVHLHYPSKTRFAFEHDNLTAHKTQCIELCKSLIDKQLPFTWGCSSRVDTVDKHLLSTMKKAGCMFIFFGIETGSSQMQKKVGKNLNLSKVPVILKICKQLRLQTITSFIVGFPNETQDDIEQTLRMIVNCLHYGASTVQLHLLSPLGGSTLYKEQKSDMYYSDTFFSDMASSSSPYEERFMKKYPSIFSAHYRFRTPLLNDYQLAAFVAFGHVANVLPNTLYELYLKNSTTSTLYNLCEKIAEIAKRKKIFQNKKQQNNTLITKLIQFFMKEVLFQIDKKPKHSKLRKTYDKDVLINIKKRSRN